uniref:Olfactory receptor 1J4-like n=1 Tax=Sus scrofa TaxID=9823 RepID=A0A8D0XTJ2_PIG
MVMAYDKYMAICQPLYYSSYYMKQELCVSFAGSWFLCCIHTLLLTLLLVQLSFCMDNTIPHFFCNLSTLLRLSCSDPSLNELVIFPVGGSLFILPLSTILGSFIHIGIAFLRVSSTRRTFKVCSTCGSHLFMVSLSYGTLAGVSFLSSSLDSNDKVIIRSVVYAVVTPLLNTFISSLRNRDIKQALEIFVNRDNFLKL